MWGQDLKWVADANLEVGDQVKFMCNTCKTETIQVLELVHSIVRFDKYGHYDPNDIWQQDWNVPEEKCQYRLFICQGCGTACLHEGVVSAYSENEIGISIFYPARYVPNSTTVNDELIPKEYKSLPPKLSGAYKEAIMAYNSDLLIACAVVLRAVLEEICVEKNTNKEAWGLEEKLNTMRDEGILEDSLIDGLHLFRLIGNDAAHHLKIADKQEMRHAIGVMEDLLNRLYEIDYRLSLNSERLAKTRPIDYEKLQKNKEKYKNRQKKTT